MSCERRAREQFLLFFFDCGVWTERRRKICARKAQSEHALPHRPFDVVFLWELLLLLPLLCASRALRFVFLGLAGLVLFFDQNFPFGGFKF